MMTLYLLSLFILCNVIRSEELFPYNPLPNPKSVVISGSARFTVLTERIIRCEYSATRSFEDRATLAVVNRDLPVPVFTSKSNGTYLVISTQKVILEYRLNSPFSGSSLSIRSLNQAFSDWRFGDNHDGNLLGTVKSLDLLDTITLNCTEIKLKNITIHDESLHCQWGLISRKGWSVFDDSDNWGLTKNTGWWDSMNKDSVDTYFLGFGDKYTEAISEYILIGGKIAIPPRSANGIWWSRWNNINNLDVMTIVESYEKYSMPLDVYILDMDWHNKFAWGGYTFDYRLFPIPEATMEWLHHKNLIVGANIHDDSGIMPDEKLYKEVVKALQWPYSNTTIPFQMCANGSQKYIYALDDIILKDLETVGLDFWWIDWQQGGTQGSCQGEKQNPTIMLSKVRATDHMRRQSNKRAMVLGRWGGLGNHRYQVGFSGDVNDLTWQSLAFQPFFSFTSSNVGYGFWSHDIVGPPVDHELHIRWVQWGAFSGVFRTHDRGMAEGGCVDDSPITCGIVEMWNLPPKYVQANRDAITARSRLLPYIYNATRHAFDSGISLLRPMYYEFPKHEQAYLADGSGKFSQYMFGENILVSLIVTPGNKVNSLANTTFWMPPGNWYSLVAGKMYLQGGAGRMIEMAFDLDEIPVFIRGGSIIPEIPVRTGDLIGLAARQYHHLVFSIYPGKSHWFTSLYEDDGLTTDYIHGKFTRTNISYVSDQTSKQNMQIKIDGTPNKPYETFPLIRLYTLKLVNYLPHTVSINGQKLTYNRFGGSNTWRFDGNTMSTIIDTKLYPTKDDIIVTTENHKFDFSKMSSLSGYITRGQKAKDLLDDAQVTPGQSTVTGGFLMRLSSIGEQLNYLAGKDIAKVLTLIESLPKLYTDSVAEILAIRPHTVEALREMRQQQNHVKRSESHVGQVRPENLSKNNEDQNNQKLFERWSYAMQLLWSVN